MPGVEGVPLYIGGGEASHSAELMRTSNFFHFRGQEGWLTANAGAATEYNTPGTGVTIMPGPFLANSRFPGGAMQSYVGRILTAVDVPTTNVPPGDPRSDLVVMNIEDPYPSDGTFWPYPGAEGSDSRRLGPYIALRVIDGVPSNTLTIDDLPTSRPERGWTCIAIARLDRPANTGTVTNSMIKNLRPIINPWAGIVLPDEILNNLDDLNDAVSEIGDLISGITNQKIPVPAAHVDSFQCTSNSFVNNTDNNYKVWPAEAQRNLIVPPWATKMNYYVEVISAFHKTSSNANEIDANVYCAMRLVVGSAFSNPSYQEFIEGIDVYYAGACDRRAIRPPVICNPKSAGQLTLNSSDIGKIVPWKIQVKMQQAIGSRLHNGLLGSFANISSVYLSFEFKEG